MEQKAAHTPGPWNCNHSSASGYDIVCSEISPTDVCVISRRDKTTGEIDANARLIAAAPELLAALETAYMALIGYLPAHRNDVTDAAIGAARAAITKATGEAA